MRELAANEGCVTCPGVSYHDIFYHGRDTGEATYVQNRGLHYVAAVAQSVFATMQTVQ
jgi:hypothetical protein